MACASEIGLQPASVEAEIDPGARARQVVTLTNGQGDRPVSVSLSLADWTMDEDGAIAFSAAGETDASAAGWARFGAPTVTLAPGQSKQVMIDLAPPMDLPRSGDYRFALVATTVVKDPAGSWTKQQIASLFCFTAGVAASHPAITGGRLTVTAGGEPAIGLDFSNPGNAHAHLQGVIEISGDDGAVVSLPIRDLVVPDGGTRRVLAPVGQALPANPVIDVRLDNVFAPQMENETQTLAPYRVETETQVSSLSGPVGGQD